MVRYKRYRKYKKSTNIITMKFQSFMDIQTDDASMQIITISAGGPEVLKRLAPQFGAYKYYKLGNIAVKLVPATTLPVDPSGLSINAGGQGVNPVDQLTPGMMRITNGEDIFENIAGLSTAEQDAIYNNMLLDPRWFKWMLQSGVKRHATPRFWQIGQLHQDKWPGVIVNHPLLQPDGSGLVDTEHTIVSVITGGTRIEHEMPGSSPYGFFQTGHSGRLGWLPTDGLQPIVQQDAQGARYVEDTPLITSPPEIEVMKILLPRARLTKYPYRLFVTETVYFREPIVNFGIAGADGYNYRPLDVFHYTETASPVLPGTRMPMTHPSNAETGGNYGDD